MSEKSAVIIGGGPAGLFAASLLTGSGIRVDLYEKMKTPGRKFLLAGQSGLNLTNDEAPEIMARRYGRSSALFLSLLRDFSSEDMRAWFAGLGVEIFPGNGGKIFPRDKSTREILDLWLGNLSRSELFALYGGFTWNGWSGEGLLLKKDDSSVIIKDKPVLFALGGASWPATGSDGTWRNYFGEKQIGTVPFKPMNCGFHVPWSDLLIKKYSNEPVKNVALELDGERRRGDILITERGIEGGPVYWFSLPLRELLEKEERAVLYMDLAPDRSKENIDEILKKRSSGKSLSSFLSGKGLLSPVKRSLLWEFSSPREREDEKRLARLIKSLPLVLNAPYDIKKAISSSGGIAFSELDNNLMIKRLPGYFSAGEMVDWEAPTGGYMLQGCFSTAYRAVRGMKEFLQ